MTEKQLRAALKRCNLSLLGRLAEMPARTLRRIKNTTGPVRQATIDKLTPHLEAARATKEERAGRAVLAAATRAQNAACTD